MTIRCRTCGKDNHIPDLADGFVCVECGATFDLTNVKVIEREPPQPSDPLEEFR